MSTPTSLLVPIDFSAPSRDALRYAISLAQRLGASIDVLHCAEVPPLTAPDLSVKLPGQPPQTIETWVATEGRKQMDDLLGDIERPNGLVLRSHVEVGSIRDTILAWVAKHPIDLIVMGTHGRTGLAHMFVGSIAEGIVRTSPVPVLTIRGSVRGNR